MVFRIFFCDPIIYAARQLTVWQEISVQPVQRTTRGADYIQDECPLGIAPAAVELGKEALPTLSR